MIIKADMEQASMQRLGVKSLGLEDIMQCKDVIKQAEGVRVNEVVKNVGDIKVALNKLCKNENECRKLLALKGETIFMIMNDVEKRGNDLLDW